MELQDECDTRQQKRPRRERPSGQTGKATDVVDPIIIDISNQPGTPPRWSAGPVSSHALVHNNDYFAALLAGGFQESASQGRIHIVLPLNDETPQCVVQALVRRAAGQCNCRASAALACLECYGGIEALSFLGLPSYDDILLGALRPDPAYGHLADPSIVLMAYLRRDIVPEGQRVAAPNTAFSFPNGIDHLPPTLWMSYVRYGERLHDAAVRVLAAADGDTPKECVDEQRASECAIWRMVSAIDKGQRDVAIARALIDALHDWRHSMHLDSDKCAIVDSGSTIDLFAAATCGGEIDFFDRTPTGPPCVVPNIHTFVQRLCADFPRMGPLLLANGGPLSAVGDCERHHGAAQARVILAGGSVVNALQPQGLARHLESSDLDLWIVGPDPEARRATFDRVVSWTFDQLPRGRCKARVRPSIVTITIDCDSGDIDDGTLNMACNADKAAQPRREYVQVIMTDAHTPDALIGGFDMVHACAWFDGARVGASWDCLRAIATRTTRPMPGVRPVLSRYDKANRKGFVPTWDRTDSPECDPSWSYDDVHAVNTHDPRHPLGRGYTSARDALAAFYYVPLVRRQPSKANHRYHCCYIPDSEERIYTRDLRNMRFRANGKPSGFCVSPPLCLTIAKATTTGSPRLLSRPTEDRRLDDYVIPIAFCPSLVQCTSHSDESVTDVLARHDMLVCQLIERYRTLFDAYTRNQTAYGDRSVVASTSFMNFSYRPIIRDDDGTRLCGEQVLGHLDIVWCNWNRMLDATTNMPIEPRDVAVGSQVSGTVRITGVRIDNHTFSLRVMVDTPFLWVYPPERTLAATLAASAAASTTMQ